MGAISKMPGWFALLLGTDRSGRLKAVKADSGTTTIVKAVAGVPSRIWAALLRLQEYAEMRAAIRMLDERTLKDIGRTRAEFDDLLKRHAEEHGVRHGKRWLG